MRPPVRLLQPLEAPSLQLSKPSLYVCSSCRHNVLPAACSLSTHHQAARRHASGQSPFTERLRQRIWGTDKPPGMEDPYGGEGVISKAWKKRKAESTGEQPEAAQEEVVAVEEEVDEAAAAAEAANVGSGKKYSEDSGFKPAKTAEGLPVIGHRGRWANFRPQERDQYSPFLTRSKATTKQHVRCAAHSAAVELCILHELKKPLEAVFEATQHAKIIYRAMMKCRINPDAQSLDDALIYPKHPDAKKTLHFVFEQLGSQTEEPPTSAEEKRAAKFSQPASKSYAVKSGHEPADKGYLSFPLTDAAVRFTYLARMAQITGHYVPDSELVHMTTVKQVVDYLEQAIAPRKKLADELSALPERQGIPNLTVKFSRYTKADHDRDVGRRKVIEAALRERGLLYEQDTSSKFRV
ncbi:hypothetical protein PISL3812_06831 [Talaromyces islandicus]|uniref:Large ribosomal subunit protein mL50 n=1 Tax=Talaromyces islandicus TaxID=28573 RepID=A0A0U1M328_TALIS|nr:hypothetical protein PISL3812_06831 [Talaromyces islandicus]